MKRCANEACPNYWGLYPARSQVCTICKQNLVEDPNGRP